MQIFIEVLLSNIVKWIRRKKVWNKIMWSNVTPPQRKNLWSLASHWDVMGHQEWMTYIWWESEKWREEIATYSWCPNLIWSWKSEHVFVFVTFLHLSIGETHCFTKHQCIYGIVSFYMLLGIIEFKTLIEFHVGTTERQLPIWNKLTCNFSEFTESTLLFT